MTATTTRIRRLYIEQLFGEGSHDIDIHFGLEQRVTALYGRNGSGKTITLALLAAMCEGRFEELRDVPFKRLRLECTDGSALELRPRSGEEMLDRRSIPPITASRPSSTLLEYRLEQAGQLLGDRASTLVGGWRRLRLSGDWINGVSVSHRGLERELARTPDASKRLKLEQQISERKNQAEQERIDLIAFEQFCERLPRPKLIRADRLRIPIQQENGRMEYSDGEASFAPTLMVELLSAQIRTLVVAANEVYHHLSTRLDGSLPQRLFTSNAPVPDLEGLRSRVQALADQERRLFELGLIGENPPLQDVDRLSEAQRATFAVILGDREEKLQPFASVVSRSERLLRSLNRKLAPKVVRLDVKSGYQVYSAVGKLIPLSRLSSGEQHELVLLHELLFEVQPGGLILIDEPELSLHVSWQEDVMKELTDIARLAELDIVVATHSPYIVGEGDPQMVRLGPAA